MDNFQKAFRFDSETLKKITRSAILSAVGAFAAYLLTNLGVVIDAITENPQVAILLTSVVTWLLNTIREWSKGAKQLN